MIAPEPYRRRVCASRPRSLRNPRLLRLVLLLALAPGIATVPGCTMTSGVKAGVRDALMSRKKRVDYKFKPDFGVEDPQFARSLASVEGMVGGNSVELVLNGDRIFAAMTADIRNAKVSVNLETFIFEDDEAGRQFADAMIEAARRGVAVRFLFDGYGSNIGKLGKELEDAGVKLQPYRELHWYTLHRPGIRTHRKLLIVDGRIGYTGGLGIDKRWLGDARNPDEWRDTQVRVTGPVVSQMQSIFSENWTFDSAEILAGDEFYPQLEPTGDVFAHAMRSTPGSPTSLPKMMYYLAIQSARRYIHIENSYFLPDRQVRRALIRAVRRGVEVEVIVPGKYNDLPFIRSTSRFHYGEMLEAGVKIYEYQPTMIHAKTLVVDGIFSTVGSINLDTRSMSINAEDSVSLYNRDVAGQMEATFQADKLVSREVTYEQWRRRGFAKRSTEFISWIWEPFY